MKPPSQCDRVLAVLRDGQPHPMLEIHERAGFMRLNSRVAELRGRGHTIVCDRSGGNYIYRLLGSSGAGEPQDAGTHVLDLEALPSEPSPAPDECEQLVLA